MRAQLVVIVTAATAGTCHKHYRSCNDKERVRHGF